MMTTLKIKAILGYVLLKVIAYLNHGFYNLHFFLLIEYFEEILQKLSLNCENSFWGGTLM